ncbi:hypothetical protein [Thermococcus stetteri]|uniref:hypothetical protein n=1 Tax=Thermococcus stetteri TaxID=49900 RepID=UPI001AE1AC2F|nr:hypothetical protein [Thermococcus stetteri]MBP1912529.1 hypothetical protein [Thermococcus stetteri]
MDSELSRALKSARLPITFGLTCAGATAVCYAALPGAQVKALISSPRSLAGCLLGSLLTMAPGFLLNMGGENELSPTLSLGLLGGTTLAGTGGLIREGLRIRTIRAGYSAMEKLASPSAFAKTVKQMKLEATTTIKTVEGGSATAPKTTPMYVGLLSNAEDALKEKGELADELASNPTLRKNFADKLDNLAKIAKAAGDDDAAKILEEAAEKMVKATDGKTITNILNRIDRKISPQKIEDLFKALKEKVKSFKENPAQICTTVGMLTATTVTSLEAIAMVGDVDQLNVKIHPSSNVANIVVSSPWMRDKIVEVK